MHSCNILIFENEKKRFDRRSPVLLLNGRKDGEEVEIAYERVEEQVHTAVQSLLDYRIQPLSCPLQVSAKVL